MSSNWIEASLVRTLLLPLTGLSDYPLCEDVFCLDGDAIATDRIFLLRLSRVGEGQRPINERYAPLVRKTTDPANYVPEGVTSLAALQAWIAMPQVNARQHAGRLGNAPVVIDRLILARPLGVLHAEYERLAAQVKRLDGTILASLPVRVMADTDKVLLLGQGFALVMMGVRDAQRLLVRECDVLRLSPWPREPQEPTREGHP